VQVSAASEKRRSRRYLIERKGLRSKQPAIMVAAFPKRVKPSIALILDLMLRWSCSIKLFKYFDDRKVVSFGSDSSAFISRTAR
jgi:hypothetical protein